MAKIERTIVRPPHIGSGKFGAVRCNSVLQERVVNQPSALEHEPSVAKRVQREAMSWLTNMTVRPEFATDSIFPSDFF